MEILSKTILTDEQKKSIDDLYEKNYGEKIPYFWHQYFTAFTGNFDSMYFPELLFVPEFEHYMNGKEAYNQVFADKNVIPLIASSVGVRTPKSFFSCVFGICRDADNSIISREDLAQGLQNIGPAFIKPTVDTGSGHGCFTVNFRDGFDTLSGRSSKEIVSELEGNFVIQEILKCHSSIAVIYAKSVNTFRVITYRWNGKIEVMPVIMRIGQGNAVIDNAHAGGMFIAVDNNGCLHQTAFTEFNTRYEKHPDTGLVFHGHRIEHFERVIDAAIHMHAAIPQVGVYNWDFTINEAGEPVLIEANTLEGGIWVIEMAHGSGAFGENTPDVLNWLRQMKRLPKSKRENAGH